MTKAQALEWDKHVLFNLPTSSQVTLVVKKLLSHL